jgi:O-antigen/teichoic acid export membrane protein
MSDLKIFKKIKEDLKQGKTLLTFTSLQSIGLILRMAAPLVIAMIFSDQWSRYTMCEPIILFFSSLFLLSSRNPFIVYANEERGTTGNIRKTFSVQCIFLAASIILFLVFIVLIAFFRKFIPKIEDIKIAELFYVALAFFGFLTKEFVSNLFMGMNQRLRYSIIEILFGLLTLFFIFTFFILKCMSLKYVFLSYFLASIFVLVISLVWIDIRVILPLYFDKQQFQDMLHFTLWSVGGTLSSYIINWVGIYILGYYINIKTAGNYNLAFKFYKGFLNLIYMLPPYFLPHISENIGNPEKIKAYLYHKRPRILLLGSLCLFLAWMFMPFILTLLYNNKYDDIGSILRILLFGNLFFLYNVMYGPLLNAMKIYKFQQFVTITQVLFSVVLNFVLIPPFGVNGAAIATVISYLYLAIAVEGYYRIRMKKIIGVQTI